MSATFQFALHHLWSLLFDESCVVCNARQRRALCAVCEAAIQPFDGPTCSRCDHPLAQFTHKLRGAAPPATPVDPECPDCARLGEPSFEQSLAVGPHRGVLKAAVLALKYHDGWRVADVLARYMMRRVRILRQRMDLLVPVPIDGARKTARGYSQSALLASRLAVYLGVPHRRRVLTRRIDGIVQGTADAARRITQVEGVFEARGHLEGQNVLIVDDVMTTAATMQAAAASLRARGARVWGAVVTRQTLRGVT